MPHLQEQLGEQHKLAFVAPASHDILVAMRRRASILILASVVSFLATQAVPARVERAADSYVLLWQSETRVKRPAPTSTISTTKPSFSGASRILPLLVGHALKRSLVSDSVRAPPAFFPGI